MEIVIVKKIYVDQNVTNVAKVIMDFQTARVSFKKKISCWVFLKNNNCFSTSKECKCFSLGSNDETCNRSGCCGCKGNFDGCKCDKCKDGYYSPNDKCKGNKYT